MHKAIFILIAIVLSACGSPKEQVTTTAAPPEKVSGGVLDGFSVEPELGKIDASVRQYTESVNNAQLAAALNYLAAVTPRAPKSTYVPTSPKSTYVPPVAPSGNSFLDCVRNRESRGQYSAVNPSSGAGGAYQMMSGTSRTVAGWMGRPDLANRPANTWSQADQDTGAASLYHHEGTAPWGGSC